MKANGTVKAKKHDAVTVLFADFKGFTSYSEKCAYDIWGDTVNVASRMESMLEPGRINISENTYALIKEDAASEYCGKYR